MQNYSNMYLLSGICAGGKALFCIVLAQITASRSKELSLPGQKEKPENSVVFNAFLCLDVCAFSCKCLLIFFEKALYTG